MLQQHNERQLPIPQIHLLYITHRRLDQTTPMRRVVTWAEETGRALQPLQWAGALPPDAERHRDYTHPRSAQAAMYVKAMMCEEKKNGAAGVNRHILSRWLSSPPPPQKYTSRSDPPPHQIQHRDTRLLCSSAEDKISKNKKHNSTPHAAVRYPSPPGISSDPRQEEHPTPLTSSSSSSARKTGLEKKNVLLESTE